MKTRIEEIIRSYMVTDKLIDGSNVTMLRDGNRVEECANEIITFLEGKLNNSEGKLNNSANTNAFDRSNITFDK